jgi:hypothetical protein
MQEIYHVGAGWVEAEDLEVERVGEPGERMPVGGCIGSESPLHGVPREARLDVNVVGYVDIVVVIDEGEMADWGIDCQRGDGEQKGKKDRLSFGLRLQSRARRWQSSSRWHYGCCGVTSEVSTIPSLR